MAIAINIVPTNATIFLRVIHVVWRLVYGHLSLWTYKPPTSI